jgi:hypothetical protein
LPFIIHELSSEGNNQYYYLLKAQVPQFKLFSLVPTLLLHLGLLDKPQGLIPGNIISCQLHGLTFSLLKMVFKKSLLLTLMEQCSLRLIRNNEMALFTV